MENKLTDKEMKKSLDWLKIKTKAYCEQCAYKNSEVCDICFFSKIEFAFDYINRLEAENEALKMENKQLQDDVINANCNYDRLAECYSKECKETETLTLRLKNANEYEVYLTSRFKTAKAEAIKEFAEKIKEKTKWLFSSVSINNEVDNLLKEME